MLSMTTHDLSIRRDTCALNGARSTDLVEIAVTAEAIFEAARPGDAVLHERFAAVVPFLNQRIAGGEAVAADGGAAVGAGADLREARDLARQRLGLRARAAFGRHIFAEADAQAFLGRYFPPGEDDLERASLADDARQAHRAAVDQRHAPAPAIDAEICALRHDAEIAPEPELHAAGHGRALDRGDDGLVELEPRRAEGTPRNLGAVAARARHGDVELAQRILVVERADIFEIPAGAERAARAIEDRDRCRLVGVEGKKSGSERIGAGGVHGISRLGPVVNDGPDCAVFLDSDCHRVPSPFIVSSRFIARRSLP